MLTVCTSSTWSDLTDIVSVQEAINAPSSEEAYLSRLIRRASVAAENYVGFPLLRATYFESVAGAGSKTLVLSRTPVTSVTKIIAGSSSTSDGTVLTSTEYRIEDADGGLLRREGYYWLWQPTRVASVGDSYEPGSQANNYWVEYTAGYVFPGTALEPRTLPDDIEQAVIEKVRQLYSAEAGVASKRLGDFAVTYKDGDAGDPFALLDPYLR